VVTLDRDDERGEVAVADDPSELLFGDEHAGGAPALTHVAVFPVLDVAPGSPAGKAFGWALHGLHTINLVGLQLRMAVDDVRPSVGREEDLPSVRVSDSAWQRHRVGG